MEPSEKANEEQVDSRETETSEELPQADLLDLVLAAAEERKAETPLPSKVDGVVIGVVVSVEPTGAVRVRYPGAPEGGVYAAVMAAVSDADVGREAALLFEAGNREKPVIMGLMFQGARPAVLPTKQGVVDGERLVFSAEKEIVLECGEASITLTRAGKILIKGKYVLSRSTGTNRIQGGSVQIN
jgi:hypothetical protein